MARVIPTSRVMPKTGKKRKKKSRFTLLEEALLRAIIIIAEQDKGTSLEGIEEELKKLNLRPIPAP